MRDTEQHDTNSADFKQGVDSAGDKNKERRAEPLFKDPSLPLFMRDSSEGKKGNPEDEKDESEE